LNEMGASNDSPLEVIGLAIDDSRETMRAFQRQHETVRFLNLLGGGWEDGEIAKKFGSLEIPTDVLVDPAGGVVHVGVGSDSLRSTLRTAKELRTLTSPLRSRIA